MVIRWGWAHLWQFFQQPRFLCHQGNIVLGLCMHNCSCILHGPLYVLSFCSEGNVLLQRAGRNGAGVPGLGRVFQPEVFQILSLEQVFFVVVPWVNIGSEDIVIGAPKGVKLRLLVKKLR